MAAFFFIFCVQALVAAVVIFILKQLLDKELIEAALEKFQGLDTGKDTADIRVRLGKMDARARERFEDLARRRFPRARLTVEQDEGLKGGVIITVGSEQLDFSVANRLKGFWS